MGIPEEVKQFDELQTLTVHVVLVRELCVQRRAAVLRLVLRWTTAEAGQEQGRRQATHQESTKTTGEEEVAEADMADLAT